MTTRANIKGKECQRQNDNQTRLKKKKRPLLEPNSAQYLGVLPYRTTARGHRTIPGLSWPGRINVFK